MQSPNGSPYREGRYRERAPAVGAPFSTYGFVEVVCDRGKRGNLEKWEAVDWCAARTKRAPLTNDLWVRLTPLPAVERDTLDVTCFRCGERIDAPDLTTLPVRGTERPDPGEWGKEVLALFGGAPEPWDGTRIVYHLHKTCVPEGFIHCTRCRHTHREPLWVTATAAFHEMLRDALEGQFPPGEVPAEGGQGPLILPDQWALYAAQRVGVCILCEHGAGEAKGEASRQLVLLDRIHRWWLTQGGK